MSDTTVELTYFRGCPHVDAARENLRTALGREGLSPEWREWDVDADETPEDRRGWPSPTVLVDGDPVEGEAGDDAGAPACRAGGAPTVASIRGALGRAARGG